MAYGRLWFCIGLLSLLSSGATANEPQRFDSPLAGVTFDLPADWALDARPFPAAGGAAGLARAGSLNGRVALQAFLYRDVNAEDLQLWTESYAQRLRGIGGISQLEFAEGNAERPLRFILLRAAVAEDVIDSVYACLRLDARTVLVLSHGTARVGAADQPSVVIPATLRNILGTLRIYHDPAYAEALREATLRGRKFIAEKLPTAIRSLRISPEPRYLNISRTDGSAGYLRVEYHAERHSVEDPRYGNERGEPGLRVTVQEWRFKGEMARFIAHDVFSSVTGQTDLYEITTSETVRVGNVFSAPYVTRDECIRAGNGLVHSFTTSGHVVLPDPQPPMQLGRDYLGLAWTYALPALLEETATEWVAFTSYHVSSRSLVPFAVRRVNSPDPEQLHFETRWGFGPVTIWKTDKYGNPIGIERADEQLAVVAEGIVEQRYAAQREAARPRLSNSALPEKPSAVRP